MSITLRLWVSLGILRGERSMKYYIIAFLIWIPLFIVIEGLTIKVWRVAPPEIFQIVVIIQAILLIGVLWDLLWWAYRNEVEEIIRRF